MAKWKVTKSKSWENRKTIYPTKKGKTMTTKHTDEMREAFEQLWSDRYQNEETFFDQFSSPQIMKDFAKLFAYEMYQAATASTDAEWRALVEQLVGALEQCESWREGTDSHKKALFLRSEALALAEAKLRGVV